MAIISIFHVLFFAFVTSTVAVSATVFTFQNRCPFTIWPGTFAQNGPKIADGGFQLNSGDTVQHTLNNSPGWTGRIWPRTGCDGKGRCVTGECNGIRCAGTGVPPVSLAEFTLQGDGGKDFYDVSLVDGFNVKLGIQPQGGSGDCRYTGCSADINAGCPNDLKVMNNGNVVACKSACLAFNRPEFCCTGDHNKPETCPPSSYSMTFKRACPTAYSYAYDDRTSTFTCTGSNYLITFCP